MPDPNHIAPRQQRSRETLERIAETAEAMLEEGEWEATTVADIAARARATPGAFYARFPSRDALLPFLYERYDRRLREELPTRLRDERWDGLPLPALAARVATLTVDALRARRGLLRALALYDRAHPERAAEAGREGGGALHAAAARLFYAHRGAIRHPDWEEAVAFGLSACAAVCRERVLFGETGPGAEARLKEEAARLLLAYLTCEPAPVPAG